MPKEPMSKDQHDLIKLTIRSMYLQFPEEMHVYRLTEDQQEIMTLIKEREADPMTTGLTSYGLSTITACTVQNASTKLSLLYHMGYLVREDRGSNSGGVEYVYFLHPLLKKRT